MTQKKFSFPACLVFIPKKRESVIGNMLLWLGIFLGTGCCGSLYMLEYYARINCPQLIVRLIIIIIFF